MVHRSGNPSDNVTVTLKIVKEENLVIFHGLPKLYEAEMRDFRPYDLRNNPLICLKMAV